MSALAARWRRRIPDARFGRALLGEDGLPVFPVAALFAVSFLAFADLQAAGVLAPDIRATFGFSNATLLGIGGLTGFLSTCAALPVGFLGDRVARVDVVVVLATVLGAATVGSAVAPAAGIYVLARLATSVGEVSNLPIQQSLIADVYPHRVRPRAFGLHRAGQPAGLIAGALVAGGVAQLWNWRVAFAAIGLPAFAIAYVAGHLREPVRGAHEGLAGAGTDAIRFGPGVRRLWRNPTLRRVWIASFVLGSGYVPLLTLFPLFYADVFHLNEAQRGAGAAAWGLAQLAGLVAGGVLGQRLSRRTVNGQMFWAGAAILAAAIAVIAAAVAHLLAVSLAAAMVANFFGGLYYAPFTQVLALVCPPWLRSTGLGGALFALGLGTAVGAPLLGRIADVHGDRAAIATAGLVLGAGGVLVATAMSTAYRDAVAAAREVTVTGRSDRPEPGGRQAALELVAVEFAYAGTQVLFGVNLEVTSGETLALLGTNGAGKSTVLRVAAGQLAPHRGAVLLDGEDVTGLAPEALARRGLVLIPGGRSVFASLTVRENLRLGTWLYRREPKASAAAIDQVLDLFPRLGEALGQPAAVLSGGERQMLGLAQGLVCRPRILLIDELTLGLAPRVVEELMAVVGQLGRRGLTLVIVEQSVNIAALVCERAYFMEKGRVRFCGSPGALLHRPDLVRSVFLGAAAQA